MPRGISLSQVEQGQILAYKRSGKSIHFIAKELGRSRRVVQNFLKNPDGYGQIKRKGGPRKLSKWDERRVIKAASNSMHSCKEIHVECGLDISNSTILRTLKQCPNIVWAKLVPAPCLKAHHKTAHLLFAQENMNCTWNLVSYFYISYKFLQISYKLDIGKNFLFFFV